MELTISGKHSTFRTVPAFWIIAAFICFKHENVQPPNKIARKVTITALSNLANMQMSGEKLMKIVVTASWKHFEIVVFFLSIRLLHMHFWAQFYHTRSFSVHFHSTIFGGSASVGTRYTNKELNTHAVLIFLICVTVTRDLVVGQNTSWIQCRRQRKIWNTSCQGTLNQKPMFGLSDILFSLCAHFHVLECVCLRQSHILVNETWIISQFSNQSIERSLA